MDGSAISHKTPHASGIFALKLLGGHRQTGSSCRDHSSSRSPCDCPDSSSRQARCHPNCENRHLCCEHSSIAPNPCYQGICVSRGHEHRVASSPTVKNSMRKYSQAVSMLGKLSSRLCKTSFTAIVSSIQYFLRFLRRKRKAHMCARTHVGKTKGKKT